MNTAQQYFTWGSLATLASASAAVLLVTNTVHKIVGLTSPLVPFVVALLITIGGAYYANVLVGVDSWGLAFLNACLLFCTATGGQEILVEGTKPHPPEESKPQARGKVKWLSSWIR